MKKFSFSEKSRISLKIQNGRQLESVFGCGREGVKENQKRKEIEKPLKKKQASGSNTMSYLKDTSKVESKRLAKELELRWKESGSKLEVPDFKINYLAVYSWI